MAMLPDKRCYFLNCVLDPDVNIWGKKLRCWPFVSCWFFNSNPKVFRVQQKINKGIGCTVPILLVESVCSSLNHKTHKSGRSGDIQMLLLSSWSFIYFLFFSSSSCQTCWRNPALTSVLLLLNKSNQPDVQISDFRTNSTHWQKQKSWRLNRRPKDSLRVDGLGALFAEFKLFWEQWGIFLRATAFVYECTDDMLHNTSIHLCIPVLSVLTSTLH